MKKVLVLDNDDGCLDMICEALSYEGFDAKCIAKTDDIISDVTSFDPDVVIMDYILNGVNGGELCRQIKRNKATSEIPVIITSAYPRVFQSIGSYECNDFIPKPFDLDDFVGKVRALTDYKQNRSLHVV